MTEGESLLKVTITMLIVILMISILNSLFNEFSFLKNIQLSIQNFWGVNRNPGDMTWGIAVLEVCCRYILFGLFMSILVKRLSRR
ncbi:hypothetical protein PsalN5692_04119 (plasmid) [Piscirickettsia salmonis]|nr:hypothetical protein PsalN5692_04119 [Piscirickettsia salmonis]